MIDWDEVQKKTGWCEEDWRMEASVENPQCPILLHNGNLPVHATEMERILDEHCFFCNLYAEPRDVDPCCPWAERMDFEVRVSEQA